MIVDVLVEHEYGHEQEAAYVLQPVGNPSAPRLPNRKVIVGELNVYRPFSVWREPLPTILQICSQLSDVGHGVAAILWFIDILVRNVTGGS